MKRLLLRILCLIAAVYCLCLPSAVPADVLVAVIYPEAEQPFAKVFEQIIAELRQQKDLEVKTYSLRDTYDPAALQSWLAREKAQTLVALGQRGVDALESLDINIPIIVGAVLYVPPSKNGMVSGISLTPDPQELFKHLKQLAPGIKRVHVVYNPDRFQWLIDHARTAAARYNIEVIAKEARDLPSAAPLYRELLDTSRSAEDSIWLLQDSTTVGNSSILPLVLKESWEKKLLVFSSNPSHVSRGVLFSLYAEQDALGKSLSRLLVQHALGKTKIKGLLPFSDLQIAVNLRTAGHINLEIPFEQRRNFGMVFPKQ